MCIVQKCEIRSWLTLDVLSPEIEKEIVCFGVRAEIKMLVLQQTKITIQPRPHH